MHSLLENYLLEVSERLRPLPEKRRNDELREIRLHLEIAFAAGREHSLSGEDAAREVLQQFGSPETVGRDSVAAWRREKGLSTRLFWSAVGCAWSLMFVLGKVRFYLVEGYFNQYHKAHGNVPDPTSFVLVSLVISLFVLATVGILTGRFFPKRAVAATALAMLPDFGYFLARTIYSFGFHCHGVLLQQEVYFLVQFSISSLFYTGVAVLFARISSGRRERKMHLANR